jgi:hypothetical protein
MCTSAFDASVREIVVAVRSHHRRMKTMARDWAAPLRFWMIGRGDPRARGVSHPLYSFTDKSARYATTMIRPIHKSVHLPLFRNNMNTLYIRSRRLMSIRPQRQSAFVSCNVVIFPMFSRYLELHIFFYLFVGHAAISK